MNCDDLHTVPVYPKCEGPDSSKHEILVVDPAASIRGGSVMSNSARVNHVICTQNNIRRTPDVMGPAAAS
jgi:hypothetical protein